MNLRYRLWNKDTKRWVDEYHYHLSPNGQIYYSGMNVTDRFEVVLFTGLTNVSGEELFYGDVIESVSYPQTHMVIRWSNEPDWHGFYCHDENGDEDTHLNMREAVLSIKVGNVYENPGLVAE